MIKIKKLKPIIYLLKVDYTINGLKIFKGVTIKYNPGISEIIDNCLRPSNDSIIAIPMDILEKQEPMKKLKKAKIKVKTKSEKKVKTKLNNKVVK